MASKFRNKQINLLVQSLNMIVKKKMPNLMN